MDGSRTAIVDVERLTALSDGVYAIVMTLLVLELKIPEAAAASAEMNRTVGAALAAQTPAFTAWLLSFVMTGLIWLRHHRLFRMVRRCDRITLLLGLMHLLFVSLIPFSSAVLGRHAGDPTAIIVFSVTLGLAGLTLAPIAARAARHPEWLAKGARPAGVAEHWILRWSDGAVATAAIGLSFLSVIAALALWGLFLAASVILRITRRTEPTPDVDAG